MFKTAELSAKSYERDKLTQIDITFERDLNQLVIARQGYTVLDLFSDVGGLMGILMTTVSIFLYAWNYNTLNNYMVSKLYQVVSEEGQGKTEKLSSGSVGNLKEFLRSTLPDCCCSRGICRKKRLERSFELGQ